MKRIYAHAAAVVCYRLIRIYIYIYIYIYLFCSLIFMLLAVKTTVAVWHSTHNSIRTNTLQNYYIHFFHKHNMITNLFLISSLIEF